MSLAFAIAFCSASGADCAEVAVLAVESLQVNTKFMSNNREVNANFFQAFIRTHNMHSTRTIKVEEFFPVKNCTKAGLETQKKYLQKSEKKHANQPLCASALW